MDPSKAVQQVYKNFDDYGICATSKKEYDMLHRLLKAKNLEWWLSQKHVGFTQNYTEAEDWDWTDEEIKFMMNDFLTSQWNEM